MKSRRDLVQSWLRKAESDLSAIRLCVKANTALDTACFHAQQAVEKYLKAYLTAVEAEFPFIHNLEQLVDVCMEKDASFVQINPLAQSLTPYAVELRYDGDFWPSRDTAVEALHAADTAKAFILSRLPAAMK
jgi:HEPN domain-containing protein